MLSLIFCNVSTAQPPEDVVPLRKGWKEGVGSKEGDLVAPVFYRDPENAAAQSMLVLTNNDGAAAIYFTGNFAEPGVTGVAYSYRYESFDGKTKREGTGELFEQRNAERTLGGSVDIDIAGLAIRWSPADVHRGWIYYSPEKVRVNLADGRQFASRTIMSPAFEGGLRVIPALDLQRFKPRTSDK
jgi:hypothetical protein